MLYGIIVANCQKITKKVPVIEENTICISVLAVKQIQRLRDKKQVKLVRIVDNTHQNVAQVDLTSRT